MKDVANWALDTAALSGASYADARVVDDRSRDDTVAIQAALAAKGTCSIGQRSRYRRHNA